MTEPSAAERRIHARIRAIPEGFVATYGDISPGAARFGGNVLRHSSGADLPWHRVVRANGSLAKGDIQRRLLEAEDVPFIGDRVDIADARVPIEILEDA